MTKKDFKAIAVILAKLPDDVRLSTATEFADMLAKNNPHFKRDLFLSACRC